MKKRIKSLVVGACLLYTLCGCAKQVTTIEENIVTQEVMHEEKDTGYDTLLTMQIDENVTMEAVVVIPDHFVFELDKIEVKRKELNAQEIIAKQCEEELIVNDKGTVYDNDKHYFNIEEGFYTYSNKEEKIYRRLFLSTQEILSPYVEELSFMTQQQAVQEVENYLAKTIGLENINLQRCYISNLEYLKKRYDEIRQSEYWEEDLAAGRETVKEEWEEDEGVYFLEFEMLIDGVPLTTKDFYLRDGNMLPGGLVDAFVTKKGINRIDVSSYYQAEKVVETVAVIGLEEVVGAIQKKFKNLIVMQPISIHQIRLIYGVTIEDEKIYLVPVWEIGYTEGLGEEAMKGQMFFDGVTGDEIGYE
jgi:hypothetical protein